MAVGPFGQTIILNEDMAPVDQEECSQQSSDAELTSDISASMADALRASAVQATVGTAAVSGSSLNVPSEPALIAEAPVAKAPPQRRYRGPRLGHLPHLRRVHVNVRLHTLDSFRGRDFRFVWVSNIFIGSGFWIQVLLVGWLTFDLTRSPLITSLALGLEGVPFLLAGPIGGVIADLWDRRKLLMVMYATRAVITAIFAALIIVGDVKIWHIFGFVFAMGLMSAMSSPSRNAMVPNVVPRQNLVNAFAMIMLAHSGTRLAVPVVAGLLIAAVGPGRTLWLGSVMYLGASLAIMLVHTGPAHEHETRRGPALAQFVDGARYVKGEPFVLAILIIGGVLTLLFMPFVHGLMPVYASEVFNVGPAGLGILMSTMGVGATLGTIVMASVGDVRYKGRVLVFSFALAIAAMVAFSRSTSVASSIPSLIVLSIALSTFFILRIAAVQAVVPDNLRGRVMSLEAMTGGLFPLGALLSGGLALLLGAPAATLMAGGLMTVVTVVVLLRFRSVWSFK